MHFKKKIDLYFCLKSDFVIKAWHSEVKTITLLHKIACIWYVKIPKSYVRNTSELCELGTSVYRDFHKSRETKTGGSRFAMAICMGLRARVHGCYPCEGEGQKSSKTLLRNLWMAHSSN
jgi:hypothetical protein